MIFFLLLTPLPARAEITVTIINGSPLEINYLYLESGEGGMGSSMNLVPGNRINMNDGNASVLRKLTVFAGTESYVFEAMNLPGPNQVLRFVLRDGGIPALVPEGEAQPSARGASFDVEAGPIWDNDHAQRRCPEVLAAWMEANPGEEAEWTGNWSTTVEGKMSVCNLRLRKDSSGGETQTSGGITGKAVPLLPEGAAPADLTQVLAARTVADLRAANITEASPANKFFTNEFFLPVTFAGTTWLARISPDNDEVFFGKNVDDCYQEDRALHDPQRTGAGGYHCLFVLHRLPPLVCLCEDRGKDDIADAVRFWNNADTPGQADAEAVMAESCSEVFNGSDPAILEGIYISAKYWDDAIKGENPAAPAMRLHVASGKNLSLIWMSDGSPLIEAGRGE